MYNLGCCCRDSAGVEKNLSEAVKWFQKAADVGNVNAMCSLGRCLMDVVGVEKT